MKLTIEKKSADSTGRQQLLLTRNYGSYLNENGKRIKPKITLARLSAVDNIHNLCISIQS